MVFMLSSSRLPLRRYDGILYALPLVSRAYVVVRTFSLFIAIASCYLLTCISSCLSPRVCLLISYCCHSTRWSFNCCTAYCRVILSCLINGIFVVLDPLIYCCCKALINGFTPSWHTTYWTKLFHSVSITLIVCLLFVDYLVLTYHSWSSSYQIFIVICCCSWTGCYRCYPVLACLSGLSVTSLAVRRYQTVSNSSLLSGNLRRILSGGIKQYQPVV